MAEVPQIDPCRECPFRNTSLKGYTGPHPHMAEILQLVHYDLKFPCHMRVSAILERERHSDLSEEEQMASVVKSAPWCSGALAYMNNTAKSIRDKSVVNAARVVGRREDVFQTPMEAMTYHDRMCRVLTPPGTEMPVLTKQDHPTGRKKAHANRNQKTEAVKNQPAGRKPAKTRVRQNKV